MTEANKEYAAHRAGPRVKICTQVSLTSRSNFYTGLADNIGEGGLFVSTPDLLPIGTAVQLEFTLPGSAVRICVDAVVRWQSDTSPENRGLGLQFLNLRPQDRDRIQAFILTRETLFFD